jgi:hypothetical protein
MTELQEIIVISGVIVTLICSVGGIIAIYDVLRG